MDDGLLKTQTTDGDKPDEWLETWVESISANLQNSTTPLQGMAPLSKKPDSVWGNGSNESLKLAKETKKSTVAVSTPSSSDVSDTLSPPPAPFISSFKAVGFSQNMRKKKVNRVDANTKPSASGDLVTLKNSSPTCHSIYYPAIYTAKLIGKGGQNIEKLKRATSVKKIKICDGMIEVQGSERIAQAVLAEVSKTLKQLTSKDSNHLNHTSKKPVHTNVIVPAATPVAPRQPTPCMADFPTLGSMVQTKGGVAPSSSSMGSKMSSFAAMLNKSSTQLNRFQCLEEEITLDHLTNDDEDAYDPTVQAGCAWVVHRQRTIEMLTESENRSSSSRKTPVSPFTNVSQDVFISILSLFNPREAITILAALSCTSRKLSLYLLNYHHRVWKSLASRAWPQLGRLRTKQPLLYPLACAMHQHRIVQKLEAENTGDKREEISNMVHSVGFNSVFSMSQVFALELEYTINPRTGECDAATVRGIVTFPDIDALFNGRTTSSGLNSSILVPCFRGARQWCEVRAYAVSQLSAVGSLQRKMSNNNFNKSHIVNPNEVRLLAPLQPLLVAAKTYMVNSSDGVELDIDSFMAIWRLLLALTDIHDRVGLARRQLVHRQLEAFRSNQLVPPDLGNFIAMILILDPSQWSPYLQTYLNKGMAKNVKWSCRELCLQKKDKLIQFYKSEKAVHNASEAEIDDFLDVTFQAGIVSRRSLLFWVSLSKSVSRSNFFGLAPTKLERDRAELVHGFLATSSFKFNVNEYLNSVNNIDNWDTLLGVLGQEKSLFLTSSSLVEEEIISKPELLHILRMSWQDGIAKGYFTEETRFDTLHASGGSNLFLIGNRFLKAAFMIDRSGSMSWPVASCYDSDDEDFFAFGFDKSGMSCFDAVTSHLMALLEGKPVDYAFSVQLFDHGIVKFNNGDLQQNTSSARKQLRKFLARNQPAGGTDLVTAVDEVLKVKGAQECFLLTDGQGDGIEVMENLARASFRDRKVPLHCIGISGSSKRVLERVAGAGGGQCVMVSPEVLSKKAGVVA